MHDYLARLIGRATATAEVVRPLSVPRFARAAELAPPGDPSRAIEEDDGATPRGAEDLRRQSPASEGGSDSMRVVARVASMHEGEASRAPSPRRNPERTRMIDGLRPDGRSSEANVSPEPLASSTLRASEARVARSSDRGSRADDAEPAGDSAERRRHVVASRVAARFADDDRVDDGALHDERPRFAGETAALTGPRAPVDAREVARVSPATGRVGLDEHPAEDARRLHAPGASRGARGDDASNRAPAEPVRIAIGRIDVRIATKEAPSERPATPAPLVSLDEYLARQGRRGRGAR